MTKILLVTDTHYGIRSDNSVFYEYFNLFNKEIFKIIKERDIKTVVHLGDLVDRRKYINYVTLKRMKEDFLLPLLELAEVHFILGNHDVYYRSTNNINAIKELFPSFKIYDSATEVDISGSKILMVPWINSENNQHSIKMISESKAKYLLGHLEIKGFEMERGSYATHGFDKEIFLKYDRVCSGHYHHKSRIDNIDYLGACYQFTWADYNSNKGVHILDLETNEMEFIPNKFSLFKKIYYQESMNIDFDDYFGSFVKVIISSKDNPYLFDKFIDSLSAVASDIQVIDEQIKYTSSEDIHIDESESTISIIEKSIIAQFQNDNRKDDLIKLNKEIFKEALELDLFVRA